MIRTFLIIITFCLYLNIIYAKENYWSQWFEWEYFPKNITKDIQKFINTTTLYFEYDGDRLSTQLALNEQFDILAKYQREYWSFVIECANKYQDEASLKTNSWPSDIENCISTKELKLFRKYDLVPMVVEVARDRFSFLINNAQEFEISLIFGASKEKLTNDYNRYIKKREELWIEYFEIQLLEHKKYFKNYFFERSIAKNQEYNQETMKPESSSGTGFYINEIGHIVTNFHVIEGCKYIYKDEELLKVIARDQINDLAILKGTNKNKKYLLFEKELPKKGEEVLVSGYPFGKDFGDESKLTEGIISALQGMGNDYTRFQIDAAIQPGNSGGPVLNKKGNVIGVAVASANIQAFLEQYGTIPQNMNFAIQSTTLMMMLITNNIEYKSSPQKEILSNSVISNKTEEAVVFLKCVY